jgi:protein-tyrosine-phosphatase
VTSSAAIAGRASLHAALGDPIRLGIVESLRCCDRSPAELRQLFQLGSNLLAHHLDVLESVGLIERIQSSADRRRRYVHLRQQVLDDLSSPLPAASPTTLFICTANSARSQLAEAVWRSLSTASCCSAGTEPAEQVHPDAVAAAKRAGLDLTGAEPRHLTDLEIQPELVVTVCDQAHEQLDPRSNWLHWSIPDPVADGSPEAFDAVIADLTVRIGTLLSTEPPAEALQ